MYVALRRSIAESQKSLSMVQAQRQSGLKPATLPPGSNGASHSTQTAGPVAATRRAYFAPVTSGGTIGIAEPADAIVSLAEVSSKQGIRQLLKGALAVK